MKESAAPLEVQVFTPEGTIRSLSVDADRPVWIGRDGICDVVTESPNVSRRHVSIERCSEGFRVTDHSSNGTYVNGLTLRRGLRIVPEDVELGVGPYRVRVRSKQRTASMPRPTEVPLPAESGVPSADPGSVTSETYRGVASSSAVYERPLRALFEPIAALLDDVSVTSVMLNGGAQVFFERNGTLFESHLKFPSNESLISALQIVAQTTGCALTEARPLLSARLAQDLRIQAVLPPVARSGPAVTIQRISLNDATPESFLESGALSTQALHTLQRLVVEKRNILIVGPRISGKTSLLNALVALVPESERVVVIEEFKELSAVRAHVVHWEGQPAEARAFSPFLMRDLLRTSLSMRPDCVVLGELRASEALELLHVMSSGHVRCMTTLEALSASHALARLEDMLHHDGALSRALLKQHIASAVNVIVQTSVRDGRCCVTGINEVSLAAGEYQLNDIGA